MVSHQNSLSAAAARAQTALARRRLLTGGLPSAAAMALSGLFRNDGLRASVSSQPEASEQAGNATPPQPPMFAPRAKRIIYIYLEGGPSQMDLFDPKPALNELHGQPLPESMLENVRFAFIKRKPRP